MEKESIFWKLPYWRDLRVKHFLDVMHIKKIVCNAILGTLMNNSVKTKDIKAVRDYFECKGLRPGFWLQVMVSNKRKRAEEICGSDKGKGSKKKMC